MARLTLTTKIPSHDLHYQALAVKLYQGADQDAKTQHQRLNYTAQDMKNPCLHSIFCPYNNFLFDGLCRISSKSLHLLCLSESFSLLIFPCQLSEHELFVDSFLLSYLLIGIFLTYLNSSHPYQRNNVKKIFPSFIQL